MKMEQHCPPTEVGSNAGLGRVLEAETAPASRTAELFVLLVRYGGNYWASHSSHPTKEKAAAAATHQAAYLSGGEAWRIVRVRDLPLHVAPGEAA
jgi:hypothetical protein